MTPYLSVCRLKRKLTSLQTTPAADNNNETTTTATTTLVSTPIAMKQLPCLRTMASTKQWVPEQEPEPGTEIKSGDLYLLSSAPDNGNHGSHANNNNDRSGGGGGNTRSKKRVSRYPVHVKVYRSCFGHYAVVTASLRAPATYLNLRTCNCRPCVSSSSSSSSSGPSSPSTFPSSSSSEQTSDSSSRTTMFRVELGGGEGQVIYFEVSCKDKPAAEVEEWIRAFQGVVPPSPGTISPSLSPIIPRNPIMPTLQESLEEEEEEEEDEEEEEEVNGLG